MSSSRTKLATSCGRCPTRIRVISSGRATAIRAAPQKHSSGPTGSSQVGGYSEARWNAEAVPSAHVPRHLRRRVAAGRRAYRSSLAAVGALQREDHGTPLRAVLQGSAGSACSFREAGLEEADSTAPEEESFIFEKACETAGFRQPQKKSLSYCSCQFHDYSEFDIDPISALASEANRQDCTRAPALVW